MCTVFLISYFAYFSVTLSIYVITVSLDTLMLILSQIGHASYFFGFLHLFVHLFSSI